MGTFSIWHILILAAIALVLFGGRGKVSDLMGDFGKGINSFKKGLAEKARFWWGEERFAGAKKAGK